MDTIKMVLEVFGIFAVTLIVGMVNNPDRATGLAAVVTSCAPLFVVLGVLYLAFGIFLWFQGFTWLLRRF